MNKTYEAISCATCRFSSSERPQANMIAPILMCRYGPLIPVPVMVSGPGGQVGQQIRALCPAVAATDWCHRFEARTLPDDVN